MYIFVQRNSAGEFARKLVALASSEYRLSSDIEVKQGSEEVRAELLCAPEGTETSWQTQDLSRNPCWKVITKSCRYAWLAWKGCALESSMNSEARIEGITLDSL